MTRKELEERRRALEAQHQADIALMNAAHEARIRSLESLWQAVASPAAKEPEAVPDRVSAPPAPVPEPAPKPRRERHSVLDDLAAALPRLPETFDKHDIVRAVGYEPPRATLFRALLALSADGRIATVSASVGGSTTRYRKLPRPD